MKIQKLDNYYLQGANNSRFSANNGNQNHSQAFGANKYELALDIFEGKQALDKLYEERKLLQAKLNDEINAIQIKLSKKLSEVKGKESEIKLKEKEYEKYNPSKYDFIDDIAEGRKQREMNNYEPEDYPFFVDHVYIPRIG
jgi:hypothetical protein